MLRWLLPLLTVVVVGYVYVADGMLCQAPISYSIGVVDERFHMSMEDIEAAVTEAAAVWEEESGRDLFYPVTADSALTINFVFDDRQERIVSEESQRENLDRKEYTTEEIKEEYKKLTATYDTMKRDHEIAVDHYETRLSAYNDRVEAFNQESEESGDTYEALNIEKKDLETELKRLQASNTKLQALAEQINDIGEKGNVIIEQYNAGVHAYNDQFGEPNEFTQGEFRYASGTREIDIYSFKNHAELINVLAHELGHALDIDHVEGSTSIMYYLMANQPYPAAVSDTDATAFTAVCGVTGSPLTTLRTFINRYIISYIYG